MKLNPLLIIVIFQLTLLSCNTKDEISNERLNTFQMTINGELWKPSVIDNKPCQETFRCDQSAIGGKIYYTIKASKDPQSTTNFESENVLMLQIMNVNDVGIFPISDTFGDFNSYFQFIKNENNEQKIYMNDTLNSAKVEILELMPIEEGGLIGIRGRFSGTLYNTINQNDSIVIDNCDFTFKRINWYDLNQCSTD
ncbi:DUF5025 domain-containing protein [Cytophagales bacterium LB-30]|uniref:DUF5025 domain-containing protein n=1 Tax=Shiella aurantiaca TaxID=3058365 RepID=A0ABT8F8P7_9BACT|nr:DUF5025 domain-containing protein [Shiella aurantiaca]MDN4166852.1 DUF5025 domain-containing protein [Shiella aurantiaca]